MTKFAPSRKAHAAKSNRSARAATAALLERTPHVIDLCVQEEGCAIPHSVAVVQTLLTKLGWSRMTHATRSMDGSLFEVTIERALRGDQPLRLSEREFAVLELSASGLSSKEVGTLLSISAETSRGTLARVNKKLGLESSGLVPLFWAALISPTAASLRAQDCERLVFERQLNEVKAAGLSEWEGELALGLILGKSNQQISLQRRVSTRTVANQLHSLFRKLHVASRGELAALMLGSRPRTR